MIERYTIKFGPAVSQRELEKALHESGDTSAQVPDLKKMKARIEFIGDFEDVKTIAEMVKRLSSGGGPNEPPIADTEASQRREPQCAIPDVSPSVVGRCLVFERLIVQYEQRHEDNPEEDTYRQQEKGRCVALREPLRRAKCRRADDEDYSAAAKTDDEFRYVQVDRKDLVEESLERLEGKAGDVWGQNLKDDPRQRKDSSSYGDASQ